MVFEGPLGGQRGAVAAWRELERHLNAWEPASCGPGGGMEELRNTATCASRDALARARPLRAMALSDAPPGRDADGRAAEEFRLVAEPSPPPSARARLSLSADVVPRRSDTAAMQKGASGGRGYPPWRFALDLSAQTQKQD